MYLTEAFKALRELNEDSWNLSSQDVYDDIKDFNDIQNDYLTDLEDEEVVVINPDPIDKDDAETDQDKIVLECTTCHEKILKNKEDVHIDEGAAVANVDEECPVCYAATGYKVVGKIAPVMADELTDNSDESDLLDASIEDLEIEDTEDEIEKPIEDTEDTIVTDTSDTEILHDASNQDEDDDDDKTKSESLSSLNEANNKIYTQPDPDDPDMIYISPKPFKKVTKKKASTQEPISDVEDEASQTESINYGIKSKQASLHESDNDSLETDFKELDNAIRSLKSLSDQMSEGLDNKKCLDRDCNSINEELYHIEPLTDEEEQLLLNKDLDDTDSKDASTLDDDRDIDLALDDETEPIDDTELADDNTLADDNESTDVTEVSDDIALDDEVEDIDDDSFDDFGESFLQEGLGKLRNYKTTQVKKKQNKIILEGIATTKKGRQINTSIKLSPISKSGNRYKFLAESDVVNNHKQVECYVDNENLYVEALNSDTNIRSTEEFLSWMASDDAAEEKDKQSEIFKILQANSNEIDVEAQYIQVPDNIKEKVNAIIDGDDSVLNESRWDRNRRDYTKDYSKIDGTITNAFITNKDKINASNNLKNLIDTVEQILKDNGIDTESSRKFLMNIKQKRDFESALQYIWNVVLAGSAWSTDRGL